MPISTRPFLLTHPVAVLRLSVRGLLTIFMGVMSLAGCTAHPEVRAGSNRPQVVTSSVSVSDLQAQAEQALGEANYLKASRLLVRIAQLSEDEEVISEAAQLCYQSNQLQAALQIAQRWLVINPTNLQAREIATLSAIKLYQVDLSVEHLQTLIDQAYVTPAAGFIDWLDKIPVTDANAALAVMKKLASVRPQMAEAQYAVARLAELTEDYGAMQIYAQRAHDLSPYWAPAGLALAKSQLLSGHADLALKTGQAVVVNDDSLGTRSEYAGLLLAAGKSDEAIQLWQELEQTEGDHNVAVRSLAYLDIQLGNYQSAFNRLNGLLNSGNKVGETIFYLAGIAQQMGATAEARQLFGRVQEGPLAIPAQVRIAYLIKDSEGLESALQSLELYAETNTEQAVAVLEARAQMLADAGDDAAALALYDSGVRDYPDVAALQLARAFQLTKMNKWSSGIQAMREVLRKRPEDPTLLNALGFTMLDHTKQYEEAYGYIKAALSATPDSSAVMDSMGWALYKLGRKQEALGYLQAASKKMQDHELQFHLGEVLWSLNRRDEALSAWQQGLKFQPDNQALQERLKRATDVHE